MNRSISNPLENLQLQPHHGYRSIGAKNLNANLFAGGISLTWHMSLSRLDGIATRAGVFNNGNENVEPLFGTISYINKDDIDLDLVADTSAWDEFGSSKVEVELIGRETSLNQVYKKLLEQDMVGLVLMGPSIHRKSKPSLILLTTDDRIFAIDPDDTKRGIEFLRISLLRKEIQFWTTDGLNEADCLYHNYGIDLTDAKANCCSGLHIHMMQTLSHLPSAATLKYPLLAVQKSRGRIRIEKFESMVEIWLDINRKDIFFDSSQLAHLKTRPLGLTAINIIKKRCILVRPLVRTLDDYSWMEARIMSQMTFDRLTNCDKPIREALLQAMEKSSERGEADIAYYAHLDLGSQDCFRGKDTKSDTSLHH